MTNETKNNIIGGKNTEIFTIRDYERYQERYFNNCSILNDNKKQYQYTNNPHDKIFRKILNNKIEAATIINKILNADNEITSNEIEKYNSSYISDQLINSEADIVYKINNQQVFFLIEHQIKIDYSMPYRILKYELEIIESVLIDKKYRNKTFEYPIVIPIVIYTGDKKWNAKLDLREIQFKWNKYKGQELSKYNILDINNYEEEELLKEDSLISKIMIIEKSKSEKELEDNLETIINIINTKKEIYRDKKELFISIIQLVLRKKLGKELTKELVNKLKNGGDREMLAVLDMIDRENKRIKKEGINEGKQEGKIEIARRLLKRKMNIKEIEELTGLSKKIVQNLK